MAISEQYAKMIRDHYAQRPKDPGYFDYTKEQRNFDRRSVRQQYSPYFQEQVDRSYKGYLDNVRGTRQSLSRNGIWGEAQSTIAPTQLYSETPTTARALRGSNYGGPRSGIRNRAERELGLAQKYTQGNIQEQYKEGTASALQNREQEAYDVYKKTIRDPYERALQDWRDRLSLYSSY